MSERIARIILLVEDVNQENLLRHCLKRLGQENRNIRVEKLRRGGSGEQFVREGYAVQVRALRSQSTRTKACLIAMIDADTGSTAERRRRLDRALEDAGVAPRDQSDPILNLVARRNVETWILCLNLEEVNEEEDYKRDPRIDAAGIKRAANRLFLWTRPNAELPDSCVPSLRESIPEFMRLPR